MDLALHQQWQAAIEQAVADARAAGADDNELFAISRRCGLGGSDMAAVLGVSKYTSPYQLWLDKTGRNPGKTQTIAMEFGSLAESILAAHYTQTTGLTFRRPPEAIWDEARPWERANLDGLAYLPGGTTPDRGVEFKTASFNPQITLPDGTSRLTWGAPNRYRTVGEHVECLSTSAEINPAYYPQVQWYMRVTGLKSFDVMVWLLPGRMQIYTVPADPDYITAMVEAGTSFWFENVLKDVPPEKTYEDIVSEPDSTKDQLCLTPILSGEATDERLSLEQAKALMDTISLHAQLRAEADALQKRIDDCRELEAQTLSRLGISKLTAIGADGKKSTLVGMTSGGTTLKSVLDEERLRRDHPELAEQYTTTTEVVKKRVLTCYAKPQETNHADI